MLFVCVVCCLFVVCLFVCLFVFVFVLFLFVLFVCLFVLNLAPNCFCCNGKNSNHCKIQTFQLVVVVVVIIVVVIIVVVAFCGCEGYKLQLLLKLMKFVTVWRNVITT